MYYLSIIGYQNAPDEAFVAELDRTNDREFLSTTHGPAASYCYAAAGPGIEA